MSELIEGQVPNILGGLGAQTVTFQHALCKLDLFTDEGLARVLETYPREEMYIATMEQSAGEGHWRRGTIEGVSGEQVLQAVLRGHLWINLKRPHQHLPEIGTLIKDLFQELSDKTGDATPVWHAGSILISSPTAFVHYHADCEPNILWHIRGQKRLRVYPPLDTRLTPLNCMEAICAGDTEEELPYDPAFEEHAKIFDLTPGTAVAFPQNAPHRVENLEGLNISLSTEFLTRQARRQLYIMRANRLIRKATGRGPSTFRTKGLQGDAKVALAVAHRLGTKIMRRPPVNYPVQKTFRVDPSAPQGYVDLP